jgi:trehalose 6-phosphate synthase
MKAKLLEAVRAPSRENTRRMRTLRRTVTENDIDAWASDFISHLSSR